MLVGVVDQVVSSLADEVLLRLFHSHCTLNPIKICLVSEREEPFSKNKKMQSKQIREHKFFFVYSGYFLKITIINKIISEVDFSTILGSIPFRHWATELFRGCLIAIGVFLSICLGIPGRSLGRGGGSRGLHRDPSGISCSSQIEKGRSICSAKIIHLWFFLQFCEVFWRETRWERFVLGCWGCKMKFWVRNSIFRWVQRVLPRDGTSRWSFFACLRTSKFLLGVCTWLMTYRSIWWWV